MIVCGTVSSGGCGHGGPGKRPHPQIAPPRGLHKVQEGIACVGPALLPPVCRAGWLMGTGLFDL